MGVAIRAQPYALNPLDITDPRCCHESHRFGAWGCCVKLMRIHLTWATWGLYEGGAPSTSPIDYDPYYRDLQAVNP